LSPEQRRYLIGQSGFGAAIVNAVINGAIGWAITRSLTEFPIWKIPGVASDLTATAFGVTFGTCIAIAIQVPRDMAKKKISLPLLSPSLASALVRLPAGTFKRACVLGAISIPIFMPLVLVALAASGSHALEPRAFVLLKAGFSALEGGIVTPFIVLAALMKVSPRET
jgi:hypothetical protein